MINGTFLQVSNGSFLEGRGGGVNGGGFWVWRCPLPKFQNDHEMIQIFSTYHSSPRSIVNIVTCHAIIN